MELRKYFLYATLSLVSVFVSCGDDGDEGGNSQVVNNNANTTAVYSAAARLEVPNLAPAKYASSLPSDYKLLVKEADNFGVNFIVNWDCAKKAQCWTCWEFNKANNLTSWKRSNWSSGQKFNGFGGNGDPFQPDPDILVAYRTELSDYKNSGYDRGHMCASADRLNSLTANGQTYYLSNMHPQIHEFNAGVWENMETQVRKWKDNVLAEGGTMYVVRGGTIYDVTINGKPESGVAAMIRDRVPVPKYFFMALAVKSAAGIYSGMAFWAEHKADDSKNLKPYMITINELEARTGYDFFCNVPDLQEEKFEGEINALQWQLAN